MTGLRFFTGTERPYLCCEFSMTIVAGTEMANNISEVRVHLAVVSFTSLISYLLAHPSRGSFYALCCFSFEKDN